MVGEIVSLSGRTAIIAGEGRLPIEVAQTLVKQGKNPFIIPIRGEADKTLYQYDHCEISIVQLSRLINALKKAQVKNVILAGGVQSRPNFSDLRFDWATISALPSVFNSLRKGDDALLRAFIGILEKYGFRVVGAHEIVPEILAPLNIRLTKAKANKIELENIKIASHAARIIGELDVGQGAVAVGGRIVALEGAEGTDNMLKRISEMRIEKRIPLKGGVLVKCVKPNQESRADLPTIGPSTIENAKKSGLSGIAVEADSCFILELDKTVRLADEYGMFIETFKDKVK